MTLNVNKGNSDFSSKSGKNGGLGEEYKSHFADLSRRLYEERMLFLCKEITEENGNQILSLLLFLSIKNETRDIFLFIDSPGGLLRHALQIFYLMEDMRADVNTIGIGRVASTASLILAGGAPQKRIALGLARISIRLPIWLSSVDKHPSYYDKEKKRRLFELDQLMLDCQEVRDRREDLIDCYVKRTGQSVDVIRTAVDEGSYMSAEQARDFGIIDLVTMNPSKAPEENLKEREYMEDINNMKDTEEIEDSKAKTRIFSITDYIRDIKKNEERKINEVERKDLNPNPNPDSDSNPDPDSDSNPNPDPNPDSDPN